MIAFGAALALMAALLAGQEKVGPKGCGLAGLALAALLILARLTI